MAPVRKYKVKTRLAEVAFRGRGMLVEDALHGAEAAMNAAREDYLQGLDLALDEIGRVLEARDPALVLSPDFYRLCAGVIDFGWCVPSHGFTQSAYRLCEIVDRCNADRAANWPELDAHVGALQCFRSGGQSAISAPGA